MTTVEKSIEVERPVHDVYNQWTQFEEFPRFMEHVEDLRQIDDKTLHWVTVIGGQRPEWYAEITEQIPDERIAWTSRDGAYNAGVVTFHRLDDNHTKVMLQLAFEPSGVVETVGDKLGFVSRSIEGDLQRFKDFIESRGVPTGAWRGEIRRDRDRVA